MGADYVIGVDLNAKNKYEKPGNILDVIMNSFHFALMAAAKHQTDSADLLITPDLSSFSMTDPDQVEDLIEQGYKDAKKALEQFK
jgi:NTE family protein